MRWSEDSDQIMQALFNLQVNLEPIGKNQTADTGKFSYDYFDLEHLMQHIRGELQEEGLVVTQGSSEDGHLHTVLLHVDSGQWVRNTIPLTDSEDPQDTGASVTYNRRYGLASILGLVSEEDRDAQGHSGGKSRRSGSSGGGNTSQGDKDDFDTSQLTNKSGTATDNQMNKLHALMEERQSENLGIYTKDEIKSFIKQELGLDSLSKLSKRQASQLIDKLLTWPKQQAKTPGKDPGEILGGSGGEGPY